MSSRLLRGLGVVTLVVSLGTAANAVLLEGKDLRVTFRFPDTDAISSSADIVVGPGTELPGFSVQGTDIDVSDDGITIRWTSDFPITVAAFNGNVFEDFTGSIVDFDSVTINPATTMTGFTSDRIAVEPDRILVNFEGLTSTTDEFVFLDIHACGDRTVSGDEQCDDGNSQDGDGCSAACESEPIDLKCWQVKDLKSPKFEKITDLPLDDQFANESVDVTKPVAVCAPADTDNSGIPSPDSHQCCYKIKGSKLRPPERVEITDPFGTLQLQVKKGSLFCQSCIVTPLP